MATGDLEKLQHLVEDLETKMEQIEVVRHLGFVLETEKTKGGEHVVPHAHTAVHVPEKW